MLEGETLIFEDGGCENVPSRPQLVATIAVRVGGSPADPPRWRSSFARGDDHRVVAFEYCRSSIELKTVASRFGNGSPEPVGDESSEPLISGHDHVTSITLGSRRRRANCSLRRL
ncbi:hypothetical protein C465_13740 [Halorubrum distributum JCM 9100]|uniref:Uncharacterized protein n=1 Tax=Halorubrum distributum JCM 9100 TaxID=1227467 RepID=M0ECQ4_9EURY|nr:hypothetical protein C465_13740 [Halorubrum distributum JCM 9100]